MDEGFTAEGEVNLVVATIGSAVACTGGKLVGSEEVLSAQCRRSQNSGIRSSECRIYG